jgi:hypothetical protein
MSTQVEEAPSIGGGERKSNNEAISMRAPAPNVKGFKRLFNNPSSSEVESVVVSLGTFSVVGTGL